MKAWVWVQSWAGLGKHEVEVLGATPKRYRVRVVQPWRVTRRGYAVGDVVLVPKVVVRDEGGKLIEWHEQCKVAGTVERR